MVDISLHEVSIYFHTHKKNNNKPTFSSVGAKEGLNKEKKKNRNFFRQDSSSYRFNECEFGKVAEYIVQMSTPNTTCDAQNYYELGRVKEKMCVCVHSSVASKSNLIKIVIS